MAIALALVSKGESIIEVGANIGTETVYYSDIVGSHGNVYAFEPFPPNFKPTMDVVEVYSHCAILVALVKLNTLFALFDMTILSPSYDMSAKFIEVLE
mgnify:CR=1 FL=1